MRKAGYIRPFSFMLHPPPHPRRHGAFIPPQAAPGGLGLALVQPPEIADGQLAVSVIHPGEAGADQGVLQHQHVAQQYDAAHYPLVTLGLLRRDDLHRLAQQHTGGQSAGLVAIGLTQLRTIHAVDTNLGGLAGVSAAHGDAVAVMDADHLAGPGQGDGGGK